ncbi:hypothetical protein GUJ93_ZPchr0006g44125 [Zizania palustris]|uniref:MSP domain-containing protein n=1 Tax=Zizania palustris TaxID=103762 RepID=A0A8J5W2X6_ZIZPA|nr:hypothetical protein GUJ93_ZPchr0006g44125 [Zizania palustris]
MDAASATATITGSALLPHPVLYHRSPPRAQLLAVSSFRRLSLAAPSRRGRHLVVHADASAGAVDPEPAADTEAEAESVSASADAEEDEAEAAVAVAEEEQEEDEPPPPSKPPIKFGEIIGILNKQFIEESEKVKILPDLRPGDIIELRMQRPNKRRLSLFKGIIIAKHKSGVHTTIRVRRIIAGVGVEITFPIYSPRIKEIKIIRRKKVRRAKLYYLKHKLPRFSTFKFAPCLLMGKMIGNLISQFISVQLSSWKESLDFTLNGPKGVAMGGGGTLVSVYPEDLTFLFELDKPCYCNLKVVNNSEHYVAFKVKTTSPRKYFVRPNANIVQPWDSCTITITLQAQKEYPQDMQCKDKFLIQSTRVAASTDMDEIPPDTFNKEADKVIEEMKLKVVYTLPSGGSDDSGVTFSASRSFRQGSDDLTMLKNASIEEIQTIQRLKEERDNTLQQNQQMQRELDVLRRRRSRKSDAGFSITFAAFAGIIGLLVGLLMSLIFSSPQATS